MHSTRVLIVGLSLLFAAAAPLAQAGPGPDDHGPGHAQGPGGGPGGRPGEQRHGPDHGQRPPQDFGPVRDSIRQHRDDFGRGQPLPPDIHIARGQPLPPGYGHPLDGRASSYLPHYPGYEWRRLGTDVVLVAIGTGIVYEILNGVLD